MVSYYSLVGDIHGNGLFGEKNANNKFPFYFLLYDFTMAGEPQSYVFSSPVFSNK